jgi:hypothetical protein
MRTLLQCYWDADPHQWLGWDEILGYFIDQYFGLPHKHAINEGPL